MKRIILFAVSIALFISCFIFNPSKGVMKIGGTGKGDKVKDLEELVDVLEFIANYNQSTNDSLMKEECEELITMLSAKNMSVFDVEETDRIYKGSSDTEAATETNKSVDTEKWDFDEQRKYSSATVTFVTSLIASSSCDKPEYSMGKVSSTSQNLQRELTLYITEDATFYRSNGKMSESRTYLDSNSQSVTSIEEYEFDMDIYCFGEDAYIQMRKFNLKESNGFDNWKSMQLKQENMDKLIQMPYDFVEELLDIDSDNREVLGTLGEVIKYLIDSDEINNDDRSIRLDESDLNRIIREYHEKRGEEQQSDYYDTSDTTIDFEVDLSSPSNPYIYSCSKETHENTNTYNDKNSVETYGYYSTPSVPTVAVTIKSSVSTTQEIMISGINKTKIKFDKDNVDFIVGTEDDWNRLFNIDERRKSND